MSTVVQMWAPCSSHTTIISLWVNDLCLSFGCAVKRDVIRFHCRYAARVCLLKHFHAEHSEFSAPVVMNACRWNSTEWNDMCVFVCLSVYGADEMTRGWRTLHNVELHNLYSSPSIIRTIKSRRMRWAGHVERMRKKRNAHRILVRKPEGKRH
jgi:hypothetical protein